MWTHLCITAFDHFLPPSCSYVGNVEINVEVKRYFCKAGVKGIQVCWGKMASDHLKASSPQFSQTFHPFLSPASWDDAGDSGASDRRCANSRGRQHVFHQAACASFSSHLCSSLHSHQYPTSQYRHPCLPCYWFLLHLEHFASLFTSDWTSIGLGWLICWIFLDLSESCWNHPLLDFQAYK